MFLSDPTLPLFCVYFQKCHGGWHTEAVFGLLVCVLAVYHEGENTGTQPRMPLVSLDVLQRREKPSMGKKDL